MLAAALLATAPANHTNAVNTNVVSQDDSVTTRVICVDDSLQLFDGTPDPILDGRTHP